MSQLRQRKQRDGREAAEQPLLGQSTASTSLIPTTRRQGACPPEAVLANAPAQRIEPIIGCEERGSGMRSGVGVS